MRASFSRCTGLRTFVRNYSIADKNVASEANRAERTLEKFWTKVGVSRHMKDEHDSDLYQGYIVTLDSKPLRTPSGLPLVVSPLKAERTGLHHLIAQEWSVLSTLKIPRHSLPLTSLAARAMDLKYSPDGKNERQLVTDLLMPYLDTDTLLIFSPSTDCDGQLRLAQEEQFWPVIQHAQEFWGIEKLSTLDSDIMLYGNRQSEEAKAKVREWINSLDMWDFAALEKATLSAKSLIGAMNLVTHRLSPHQVADLVNIETIYQTRRWGEVEDTHDVDKAEVRKSLGSAYIISK